MPVNQCKYCKKEFKREGTLLSHSCEMKRRWLQKNNHEVQIAYLAWLKFMDNVGSRKKIIIYEDFMESKLYSGFVRFGNHMKKLNAIDPTQYTDYLIKHSIKLNDWTKDFIYETYLKEMISKESPDKAIARGLQLIEDWAVDNDLEMKDFFFELNENEGVFMIITGKVSPWMLFCSTNADQFLNRLNEEQISIVEKYIDRPRWKLKLKKFKTEVNTIQEIFRENGI